METAECTRFEVLLESIQTSVKVIAEGHGTLTERFDQMDRRFDRLETRFDVLETRFDVLETRFDVLETRFDVLETRFNGLEIRFDEFASDTQRRLKRIETHLQLNGSNRSHQRPKATKASALKRRTKS